MNRNAAGAVLDASALLALLNGEPGADRVRDALEGGALVSAVNWAEVLARLVVAGGDLDEIDAMVLPPGDGGQLQLVPFDAEQARASARLVRRTRSLGLSLADRAALGLATLRRLPVLTTDRAWRPLRPSVDVRIIR